MTTRLVRYPLDPETLHLDRDEAGHSRPLSLDDRGVGHMQGATVVDGTYYVTVSRGRHRLGHLYVGTPRCAARRTGGRCRPAPRTSRTGPRATSCGRSRSTPGRRYVYAMDRRRLGSVRSLASVLWRW